MQARLRLQPRTPTADAGLRASILERQLEDPLLPFIINNDKAALGRNAFQRLTGGNLATAPGSFSCSVSYTHLTLPTILRV